MEALPSIAAYRRAFDADSAPAERIPTPHCTFLGDAVRRKAEAALLAGQNLLLVGEKSTEKNVLAENLGTAFPGILF